MIVLFTELAVSKKCYEGIHIYMHRIREWNGTYSVGLKIDLGLAVGRRFTFETDEDQTKNKYIVKQKLSSHTTRTYVHLHFPSIIAVSSRIARIRQYVCVYMNCKGN